MEVVMRIDVRVEPGARAIDRELPDEAACGKQVERVVNRGLRDARTSCAQLREDLLGREVLTRRQQQGRDAYALGGLAYAALAEALFGSVTVAGDRRRDAEFHGGGL